MTAVLAMSYGLAASVFVPVFVDRAVVMLRSAGRALVIGADFHGRRGDRVTLAALAGGRGLMRSSLGAPPADTMLVILFAAAARSCGGMLAVFISGASARHRRGGDPDRVNLAC